MNISRLLRIALPAGGALLIAGGAIAVTALAASPSPSPSPKHSTAAGASSSAAQSACDDFLGHLSSELKISKSKLESDFSTALKATVADQVKQGTLTQAEADKISARAASNGSLCAAAGAHLGRHHGGGAAGADGMGLFAKAKQAYLEAAASALGISSADLQSDLQSGQTLSQVAATKGVSEDDFKTRVVAALKPQLDALVTSGTLTQSSEDKILSRLQQGDPPMWNGVAGKPAA